MRLITHENIEDYVDQLADIETTLTGHAELINLREKIDKLLKKLPERYEQTLRMRMGLKFEDTYGKELLLEEIGDIFGCERQNINQLENRALSRLRRLNLTRELKEFLLTLHHEPDL